MANKISKIVPYWLIFMASESATLQDHFAIWIIFKETIPCKEWTDLNEIFQGILSISISKDWIIFLVKFSYSIQGFILFLSNNFRSLVCQIFSNNAFLKNYSKFNAVTPNFQYWTFLWFWIVHHQCIFCFFKLPKKVCYPNLKKLGTSSEE